MKRLFFYILSLVAMVAIFASCSNDANGASDDNKDKGVIVTIRLDRATMTRVMGDPNATDANSMRLDSKIEKVGFLIFDAAGNLVTRHNDVFEENKVYRFSTTDDAHEMYIVTNVDANILREVNVKNDLTNKAIVSLKENDYSAIPMIGRVIISITENEFNANVQLKRLLARVGVKNISVNIPSGESFTPKEIFVCRANDKHALLDGASATPWDGYSYSDFIDLQDGNVVIKGATGETSITGSLPGLTSGYGNITLPVENDRSTWQYFYVFPHDATNPTRMVLKGIYRNILGDESVVYYPVIMNHVYNTIEVGTTSYTDATTYADDSKLEANKSYMLDLSLSGEGAKTTSGEVPHGSHAQINFTVGGYTIANQVSEIQLEEEDRELSFNVTITIVNYKIASQHTTL